MPEEMQSASILEIPQSKTQRTNRAKNAVWRSQIYDPAITYKSWCLKCSASASLALLGLLHLITPNAVVWTDYRAIVVILIAALAGYSVGYAISARNLLNQLYDAELDSESVTQYQKQDVVEVRNIGGNTPYQSRTINAVKVEHAGLSYTWQPAQLDAMRQRHLAGQRQARDPLNVTGSAWGDVQRIMQGLGYWSQDNTLAARGGAWLVIDKGDE